MIQPATAVEQYADSCVKKTTLLLPSSQVLLRWACCTLINSMRDTLQQCEGHLTGYEEERNRALSVYQMALLLSY